MASAGARAIASVRSHWLSIEHTRTPHRCHLRQSVHLLHLPHAEHIDCPSLNGNGGGDAPTQQ